VDRVLVDEAESAIIRSAGACGPVHSASICAAADGPSKKMSRVPNKDYFVAMDMFVIMLTTYHMQ
jgi:hypothetical protein